MSLMMPEDFDERDKSKRVTGNASQDISRPSKQEPATVTRPYLEDHLRALEVAAARFVIGLALPKLQPAYLFGDTEFAKYNATQYAKVQSPISTKSLTIKQLEDLIRGFYDVVSGGIKGGRGHVSKWVAGSVMHVRSLCGTHQRPSEALLDESWKQLELYKEWVGALSISTGMDHQGQHSDPNSVSDSNRSIRTWRLAEATAAQGVQVLDRRNGSGKYSVPHITVSAMYYAVETLKTVWKNAILREVNVVASTNSDVGGPVQPLFEEVSLFELAGNFSPDIEAKFTSKPGHLVVELSLPLLKSIRGHVADSLATELTQTYFGDLQRAIAQVGGSVLCDAPIICPDKRESQERLTIKFSVPEKRSKTGASRTIDNDRKHNVELCFMGRELRPTFNEFIRITTSLHEAPIFVERQLLFHLNTGYFLKAAKAFADEHPDVRSIVLISDGPENLPFLVINAAGVSELATRPAKYHTICAGMVCREQYEQAYAATTFNCDNGIFTEFHELQDPTIVAALGKLLELTESNLEIRPRMFELLNQNAFLAFPDLVAQKVEQIEDTCGLSFKGCRLVVSQEDLPSDADQAPIERIKFYLVPRGSNKKIWGAFSIKDGQWHLEVDFDASKFAVPQEACNTLRTYITERYDGSRLAELSSLPEELQEWVKTLSILDDLSNDVLRHELSRKMFEDGYACGITEGGRIKIYKERPIL